MRTTVTLDSDTEQIVRERMQRQDVSFKKALNDAIRGGATKPPPFRTKTARLGVPKINLDKALQIAGELETQESIRQMQRDQ